MFKSTILVAAAIAMIDKGVFAMGPQGHGLAIPDIGQTNPVLDNPTPSSAKSNYARAFAQDWHPDSQASSRRDTSTRTPPTSMRAPVSEEHATTSDFETSDVLGSSTEGNHSLPKRSTTIQESLSATRAFGSSAHPFAKWDPRSANGRPYSTSPLPVSEHRLSTLRTLDADDHHVHSHQFDQQSFALAGLRLSVADMSTLTALSASIATTILGGILAATFLFGTAAMTRKDVKLSPSTGPQITQAEQRCLDWRARLCQRPSFVGENVGTMAVF